jgi:hypothetical protein
VAPISTQAVAGARRGHGRGTTTAAGQEGWEDSCTPLTRLCGSGRLWVLAIQQPPEHDGPALGPAVGVDHADTPAPAAPALEATTSKQVLAKVSRIGTWMTQWRAVILAIRDAAVSAQQQQQHAGAPSNGRTPEIVAAIANTDVLTAKLSPIGASTWLADADGGTTAERLVGPQVETLALSLEACAGHWPHPGGPISEWPQAPDELINTAETILSALNQAAKPLAILLLIKRAIEARVGERVDVAAALGDWFVPDDQAPGIVAQLARDQPRLDEQPAPIIVDTKTGSLYRKPGSAWEQVWTETAAVWGTAAGLGLMIATFALLHAAHLTDWPHQWLSKMIVLYLFVVAGAAAHVGSLSLAQIRFDDPLRIYAASTGLDWLRLRWLSILRLMIPVVIVAGSLWGAGNIPNNFQDLGVALLAGYSADSIFRSSVARLASNSAKG